MNRLALYREERLDLLGHIDQALDEIRKVLELSTPIGPVLVETYRCMSALRALRDVVDGMPVIDKSDVR